MMSMQEMSDRLEIQDLLSRYSYAVDEHDWDAFDDIFTPDAVIDYTETGGARGTVPEIKAYLAGVMPKFSGAQHMVATSKLKLDGDRASARTILFNPLILPVEGKEHVFFVGLWYRDKLVRTPQGWRIQDRYEERSYFFNAPDTETPPA